VRIHKRQHPTFDPFQHSRKSQAGAPWSPWLYTAQQQLCHTAIIKEGKGQQQNKCAKNLKPAHCGLLPKSTQLQLVAVLKLKAMLFCAREEGDRSKKVPDLKNINANWNSRREAAMSTVGLAASATRAGTIIALRHPFPVRPPRSPHHAPCILHLCTIHIFIPIMIP
jgi:hypothetical protein